MLVNLEPQRRRHEDFKLVLKLDYFLVLSAYFDMGGLQGVKHESQMRNQLELKVVLMFGYDLDW